MEKVIRNQEMLKRAESIRGIPLSKKDISLLKEEAIKQNVMEFRIGTCSTFSKGNTFFVSSTKPFVFVRDGKIIPYVDIDKTHEYFLGFYVEDHIMYIYGYYPYEND